MTLEKAIEIQTTYVEHLPPGVNENYLAALKLGIEALRIVSELRQRFPKICYGLLPGETID